MNQIPWKSLTQKMIELKILYNVNKSIKCLSEQIERMTN